MNIDFYDSCVKWNEGDRVVNVPATWRINVEGRTASDLLWSPEARKEYRRNDRLLPRIGRGVEYEPPLFGGEVSAITNDEPATSAGAVRSRKPGLEVDDGQNGGSRGVNRTYIERRICLVPRKEEVDWRTARRKSVASLGGDLEDTHETLVASPFYNGFHTPSRDLYEVAWKCLVRCSGSFEGEFIHSEFLVVLGL
jgi:hypothetical protein